MLTVFRMSCPNAFIGHPVFAVAGFPLKTCGNDRKVAGVLSFKTQPNLISYTPNMGLSIKPAKAKPPPECIRRIFPLKFLSRITCRVVRNSLDE